MRSVTMLAASADWHRYDLPPDLIGKVWGGRYRGQQQRWFAVRFDGPESEIDLAPAAGHEREFETWQWVEPGRLVDLVVPFKRAVYRAVLDEFRPLLRPGQLQDAAAGRSRHPAARS